jgi:hypothetical protein
VPLTSLPKRRAPVHPIHARTVKRLHKYLR